MADEFKEFDTAPQLVFGADEAPAAATPAQAAEAVTDAAPESGATASAAEAIAQAKAAFAAAPAPSAQTMANNAAAAVQEMTGSAQAQPQQQGEVLNDSMLTEEEKAQVSSFAEQIDIHNTGAILQYGAGAQKKMADFSQKALDNVRTKDMGEVGDMISGLVTELKSFDVSEEDKGFFSFFKKQANKLTGLKAKYDQASDNVDKICQSLEDHQVQLIKDIATLDKMYDLNLTYFKELTMYILAGKKKLQSVRENELADLRAKAQASGLAEDAQAAKDLDELCERFEKKLYDLELTRTVALQTAPQIRLVQDSDEVMVEKIQSTLVNTIPLWKNQMVIAMGVEHSNQAAKAQQEVTDVTNELLRKNAEKLHGAVVETAKQSERGIVDMETLKHTNEQLIATLNNVVKIQEEGKTKRAAAELEMGRMEAQLKDKLLEMSAR